MPKKKRRQIHVSGVNMFNKCGMQFAFRYIQGIRRPPNAFTICGTATDKAVTWDLDTKIVSGVLAHEDELTDMAVQAIRKHPEKDAIKLDPEDAGKSVAKVIEETEAKAVRLVKCHHQEIAPQITPFRTARKFTVNLDKFLRTRASLIHQEADSGGISSWRKRIMHRQAEALNAAAREGIDFVGEQDIVEKIQRDEAMAEPWNDDLLNIRDTKTTAKSKNQDDVDNDDQLTAYATASMVVDGKVPDKLIFDVLVDLKKGVKPQTLTTHRDKLDVDVFLNRVANAVGAIQQGIFVPTQQSNWWCSQKWCAYTEHCPYFRATRRPDSEMLDGLEGSVSGDDLLPVLNQSVVLARKGDEDDADF